MGALRTVCVVAGSGSLAIGIAGWAVASPSSRAAPDQSGGDACRSQAPREVRNGERERPQSAVGIPPILLAGVYGPTATPAIVVRGKNDEPLDSKLYLMYAKNGPPSARLSGWMQGDRRIRVGLSTPAARKPVEELVVRKAAVGPAVLRRDKTARYLYQPVGIRFPRPGCYTLLFEFGDRRRGLTLDLTDEAIRRPPPRAGSARRG